MFLPYEAPLSEASLGHRCRAHHASDTGKDCKDWTSFRPLLAGDFNGDGKEDIAYMEVNGQRSWFAGKGQLAPGKNMWPTV
ncbi:FG-GAP repeat protein [Streptomyces sp. NPDC001816]|uniref:FG-GAP repeat protein n=1 Tax=Streptomyces sp. NPDC001816 TaxID=3364612 RepID=UPI0036A65A11